MSDENMLLRLNKDVAQGINPKKLPKLKSKVIKQPFEITYLLCTYLVSLNLNIKVNKRKATKKNRKNNKKYTNLCN